MPKYDLSVLIPARNEEFLDLTVKSVLENKRGKTEVIVFLDGNWPLKEIEDHKDLTLIYSPVSVGQRAGTNQACRISQAKYVMKIDAHTAMDEGFDVKLIEDMEKLEKSGEYKHYTMIPALYNLHAFDLVCPKCQFRKYQGPIGPCEKCGTTLEKEIIWKPRMSRRSEFYRFDTTLHFQYHGARKEHKDVQGQDIVDTMSAQGSCFMLTRKMYWELNISDEEQAGKSGWGQQGTEVACKTWLSGGRLVTNRRTWYSHMFRTQPGFGFPYALSGSDVAKAREKSQDMWFNNKFDKQIYPLSWLIEKFYPLNNGKKSSRNGKANVPDWHDPEGKEVLDMVNKKGEEFYKTHPHLTAKLSKRQIEEIMTPKKGIIYYTDNQLNLKIAHAVKRQLKKVGLPIVSTSLKPMDFGKNIHMKGYVRGWKAYFNQILTALENSDADIIYFCEHDWLYHPSHFDFIPPRKDTFYYNWNWWRVRSADGHAVHYDTQLLPGIVAYRELLLEYYTKQIKLLEEHDYESDYVMKTGFEPGTHNRIKELSGYKTESFESEYPNIDIRHTNNLTSSKWSPDAFRSPKNAQNWKVTEEIPGWGRVKDRFQEFLASI